MQLNASTFNSKRAACVGLIYLWQKISNYLNNNVGNVNKDFKDVI